MATQIRWQVRRLLGRDRFPNQNCTQGRILTGQHKTYLSAEIDLDSLLVLPIWGRSSHGEVRCPAMMKGGGDMVEEEAMGESAVQNVARISERFAERGRGSHDGDVDHRYIRGSQMLLSFDEGERKNLRTPQRPGSRRAGWRQRLATGIAAAEGLRRRYDGIEAIGGCLRGEKVAGKACWQGEERLWPRGDGGIGSHVGLFFLVRDGRSQSD